MRLALDAIQEELRRLKSIGVSTVAVSDESVAALRRVLVARAGLAREIVKISPSRPAAPAALASATPKPYEPPPYRVTPMVAAPLNSAATVGLPPVPPCVTLPDGDKRLRWAALRDRVLNDPFSQAQVAVGEKLVFGVGSLDAKILLVGDAPVGAEAVQGEPWVGPAGQLLTKMLQAMGLKRDDVYLVNMMSWRPKAPGSEGSDPLATWAPSEGEIAYSLPFLSAQIEVVDPVVVVALGLTAAQGLLGASTFKAFSDIRGQWQTHAGKPVMVTYHPNYILRHDSNRSKRMIWDDLLKVMARASLVISEKQRGFFTER